MINKIVKTFPFISYGRFILYILINALNHDNLFNFHLKFLCFNASLTRNFIQVKQWLLEVLKMIIIVN